MAIISWQEGIRKADEHALWSMRGKAIQNYANLEQALCRIFSLISGTDEDVATIIFFKISSYDARNKIIEKLFKKKFGAAYNLFRNSLLEDLRPINIERNEIVHWGVTNMMSANEASETIATLTLKPLTAWMFDPNAPSKTTDDLITFSHKCWFYARLCNMFYVIEKGTMINFPKSERQTWIDIFQQPIVYPPPEAHPLYLKPQA
jgi:hypothetical protein